MHKLILTYLSDPRNGALSRSFDAVKWLAKSKGEKSNGGSYGYYDEAPVPSLLGANPHNPSDPYN